jgi:hypothetical protein
MGTATVFDPKTGEVIGSSDDLDVAEVRGLADMGKWLIRLDEQTAHLSNGYVNCLCDHCNANREYERSRAVVESRMTKLAQQKEQLMARAEYLLNESGEKRLGFPGIGIFRMRKIPASVDRHAYDDMTTDEQVIIQDAHPELFKRTLTVKPIIADIAARLKAAASGTPDMELEGFTLNIPDDKFEFKSER